MKWWALQDRDDPEPYAVMALDDDGLPRRYVPDQGLVHWPALAMFVFGGETGATPIEEDEAIEMIKEGVGAIDPGFVVLEKGQAPTIPAPGEDDDEDEDEEPPAEEAPEPEEPAEEPPAAPEPPAEEPAPQSQPAT